MSKNQQAAQKGPDGPFQRPEEDKVMDKARVYYRQG
jgi:hypothetical protein